MKVDGTQPRQAGDYAPGSLERLAQFRKAGELKGESLPQAKETRALLIIAVILSSMGSLLLVCALVVSCAPSSAAAGALLAMIDMVFGGWGL